MLSLSVIEQKRHQMSCAMVNTDSVERRSSTGQTDPVAQQETVKLLLIIIIIDDYGRRRMPLSPHLLQLVINT